MLSTAPYVARRSGSSMALRRMKYAMMMSMRMRYVVRRGSHVHHTPHSNLVHKSPVIIVHATNSSAISIAIFEQVSKAAVLRHEEAHRVIARERQRDETDVDSHRHMEVEDLLRQQQHAGHHLAADHLDAFTAAPFTGEATGTPAKSRSSTARRPQRAPSALSGRAIAPLPAA